MSKTASAGDFTPGEGSNLIGLRCATGVGWTAWLLDPIVAAIRAPVFAADKIHNYVGGIVIIEIVQIKMGL